MVNVRLTEQEFEFLCAACERHGRSISEFARTALLDHAARPEADAPFSYRISSLDRKLSDLQSTFTQLVENMEALNRVAGTRIESLKDDDKP